MQASFQAPQQPKTKASPLQPVFDLEETIGDETFEHFVKTAEFEDANDFATKYFQDEAKVKSEQHLHDAGIADYSKHMYVLEKRLHAKAVRWYKANVEENREDIN